jgi:hypothetical protein
MAPKGALRMAILRCTYSNVATKPHDDQYFEDIFVSRGTRGLNEFIIAVSHG